MDIYLLLWEKNTFTFINVLNKILVGPLEVEDQCV